VPVYNYLKHVETEFVEEDEGLEVEAEEMLSEFFKHRKATQYRAFTEDDLRYIVVSRNDSIEIIEEEGDWQPGKIEINTGNNYELIYEDNGSVNSEEVEVERAETHLL